MPLRRTSLFIIRLNVSPEKNVSALVHVTPVKHFSLFVFIVFLNHLRQGLEPLSQESLQLNWFSSQELVCLDINVQKKKINHQRLDVFMGLMQHLNENESSLLMAENWRVKCLWRRGAKKGGEGTDSTSPLVQGTTWHFISTRWSWNHLNRCSLRVIEDKVTEPAPPARPPHNIISGQKRAPSLLGRDGFPSFGATASRIVGIEFS